METKERELSTGTGKVVSRSARAGRPSRLPQIAAAGLLAICCLTTEASAQAGAAPQAATGHVGMPVPRSIGDMAAFEATNPGLPEAMAPSLPTMDFAQYLKMRSAAGPAPGGRAPASAPASPNLLATPNAAATEGTLHCDGIGQADAGGGFPPNPHSAIGAKNFGLVVNGAVRFYPKRVNSGNCLPAATIHKTLAAFFGYSAQALFDPRIVYDLTYDRWIVSAAAFPESSTVQHHFIAVSKDSNPGHGFLINDFNVTPLIGNGVFWDFPQIGYDEEAIIVTANKFNPGYIGSTVLFLPKHRLYAGRDFDFSTFNNGSLNVGTIAPPVVLDQGPYTVLTAAAVASNSIRLTKWVGTSRVQATFLGSNDVATLLIVPPLAQQPGFPDCSSDPAHCLDTLDGRFQNSGTQLGTSPVRLWHIRTGSDAGFPTPISYKINADTDAIEETCQLFASLTSYDFNPAIVANSAGTIFLTWSSTDPANNHNAQVRISGKKTGDACTVAQTGAAVSESANPLTGNLDTQKGVQAWGQYSSVTLDPADDGVTVWGVNEKVQTGSNPTSWGTFLFNMTNP